ncbi:hypothetical protein SAMN05421819_0131 [Bryocella elongata]|uniref:Peptidase M50 domain-containing protein n=1 Tax=Bryocella elongata TaxID=863522 RepID=A0A1H5SCM1_9BACT|nr:site-2 protease family protein [Bryocella elongata]SEF47571.1 hypothetical protein SAMN05421819_0131 [Bryocella elongata]
MATPAILQDGSGATPPETARPHRSRLWFQALLLLVTLFSTTVVGMRYMANFRAGLPPIASDNDVLPYGWAFAHAHAAASGLPFSLTLLTILLVHEMGHYLAARRYAISATLPYVIPAPSLSGTAGAIIRLEGRVTSRSALLAVGALGPVSGFLVAIAAGILGLHLSRAGLPIAPGLVEFHFPLLLRLLSAWIHPHVPASALTWHPVLVAAWIGVLITSLNLVPAGQFDGGHVLYAFSPRAHRWFTWATIATLLCLGVIYWIGWILWACLLLLPGMRHPRISESTPLSWKLALLGPACLAIFLLSATPQPFGHSGLIETIHKIQRTGIEWPFHRHTPHPPHRH